MLLTAPPVLQFKSLSLVSPFLHGATARNPFSMPNKSASAAASRSPTRRLVIKAIRSLQGKVVCASSDKTVAVEVVRLAPHPKYKRRVKKKKKYQAHDPLNQFKVGDLVQLEQCSPISKNKTFRAVAAPVRNRKAEVAPDTPQELGIGLESDG